MSLDVREMLLGQITKMRYVYRFQGCRVYDRESIAEHTGYVVIYCDLIARYCELSEGIQVDYRTLMHRAVVHDMEEVITGDFPRPYKYSNDRLRMALEEAAPRAFMQVVQELFRDNCISDNLLSDWVNAKDHSLEGFIIRLSDYMSALSFIVQEVQAGNKSMRTHNWTLRKGLDELDNAAPEVLRPILSQLRDIVMEYMP